MSPPSTEAAPSNPCPEPWLFQSSSLTPYSRLQDLDAECLRRTELETKLKGLQSFVELMRTVYEQVREQGPRGAKCSLLPGQGRSWMFNTHCFQPVTSHRLKRPPLWVSRTHTFHDAGAGFPRSLSLREPSSGVLECWQRPNALAGTSTVGLECASYLDPAPIGPCSPTHSTTSSSYGHAFYPLPLLAATGKTQDGLQHNLK